MFNLKPKTKKSFETRDGRGDSFGYSSRAGKEFTLIVSRRKPVGGEGCHKVFFLSLGRQPKNQVSLIESVHHMVLS